MRLSAWSMKVRTHDDIIIILSKLRIKALKLGLNAYDTSRVITAASELAHNILKYAGNGTISFSILEEGTKLGVELVASDSGPGIPNVEQAMTDHFSTSGTLGLGLPGVKRLVDEFDLNSEDGVGTTVTFKVWKT